MKCDIRQACFDYLSLGGTCSSGALLSGLNQRPLSLVSHFFAVAILGVGRLMFPFPSPKRMWLGARLITKQSISASIAIGAFSHESSRRLFPAETCFQSPELLAGGGGEGIPLSLHPARLSLMTHSLASSSPATRNTDEETNSAVS
ncbi:hypothetical protein KSP40_PGU012577 [Platanthera guangdongensis]|uniref:Squalene monooxygenase n=1 Tax=Platanthera guangdongensis TaxID=2320717 RepID=A0ABR2MLH8_9ASPA